MKSLCDLVAEKYPGVKISNMAKVVVGIWTRKTASMCWLNNKARECGPIMHQRSSIFKDMECCTIYIYCDNIHIILENKNKEAERSGI